MTLFGTILARSTFVNYALEEKTMIKNFAVSGIHVGEHSFEPSTLISEFEQRGVQDLSFLVIRTREEQVEENYFYEWAKWCHDHKVYFMYLYTVQHAPEGKKSQFTKEVVDKIKEIAGEYFLGDQIGEVGSVMGAEPKGYHDSFYPGMPQNMPDLEACRQEFIKRMRVYTDIDKELGIPYIVPVEATALIRYTLDAGCNLPMLEMMPGDPEFLVSLLRGCANAYDAPSWGTYIAQEWYGGLRNDDPLKYQRLKAAYRYAFLSGSHIVCLESGDERIQSFGYDYPAEHPFCQAYRSEIQNYEHLLRSTPRPSNEPEVRIAFVYGNLDAFTSWQGGAIWEQYDRDEWSYSDPEWSWRILEEFRHGRAWQDIENYGKEDLSAFPAYGLYDVIPACTDTEHLAKYDAVIFVGWNSMTPEIYSNLKQYAENGGRVIMTAAHLNTDITRDGRYLPIFDGNVQDLCGCQIVGKTRINTGIKFIRESQDESILYPIVGDGETDPILTGGVRTVSSLDLAGAKVLAVYHDNFVAPDKTALPAVIENKIGKGTVTLITAEQYPGNNAVWPLYKTVVREQITASHRRCPIHVKASDKLRFSVYRNGTGYSICLLNTDFTNSITVHVDAYGKTYEETLSPCELKWLHLK